MTPVDRIKMPPGFWTGVQKLGIVSQDLVRSAKLPLTVITEPSVTTADYFAIWQAYAECYGNAAEAMVRMVQAFEPTQYPPTVLATYHARDYRDALNRMARYKRMCPPEHLRIEENKTACTIELGWTSPETTGPPVLVGTTLAFLLELGRRGTGKVIHAQSVELIEKPSGDMTMLEQYLGCPVTGGSRQGGSRHNRIILRREDLDLPFATYNEELLELLTPALGRSLDERRLAVSMAEKTKWIIKRGFTAGRPDIRFVARELGLGERTLQRRLTAEHTTFHELLTEARREQAREYLADLTLDIQDIAFLVGYEDQNSFYRAFRLWEGDTPANWRARQKGM